MPAALICFVVRSKLLPGRGHAQAQLLVDLPVVEDAAAHRGAGGHAEDLPALGHGRQEGFGDVGDVRLARDVDESFGRIQGLEQRAGIVEEEVGHFTGGQPRLDDVVAIRAARSAFDGDGHIRILRHVGLGQRLGHRLVGFGVIDEIGQRHGPGGCFAGSRGFSCGRLRRGRHTARHQAQHQQHEHQGDDLPHVHWSSPYGSKTEGKLFYGNPVRGAARMAGASCGLSTIFVPVSNTRGRARRFADHKL